jgi:hypothetical protein
MGSKYTNSVASQENAVGSVSFQRVEIINRPLCRCLDELYRSQVEALPQRSEGGDER